MKQSLVQTIYKKSRNIGVGYFGALKSSLFFIILLLILGSLSLVIVYPLWYFSINFKNYYTIFTAGLVIGLLISFFVFKLLKYIRKSGIKGFLFIVIKFIMSFLVLFIIICINFLYSINTFFIIPLVLMVFYIALLILTVRKDMVFKSIYRISLILAILSSIYWVIVLYVTTLFIQASCTAIIYLIGFGYLLYGSKRLYRVPGI